MPDVLRVTGLGRVDGRYEFDIVALLAVIGPEALTSREQHQIRMISGIRGAEISEAAFAGDAAVMVALTAILLQRNNRRPNVDALWDARMVASAGDEMPEVENDGNGVIQFHLSPRDEEPAETVPPAEAPPQTEVSRSGGATSSSRSESQDADPSRTGHLASLRSATSPPETLAS